MIILGVDPGNTETAFVYYDTKRRELLQFAKWGNDAVAKLIIGNHNPADQMAIEMVASFGMPVGRDVFETCVWVGRFVQACEQVALDHTLVYRREVKLHLCGSVRAKDGNVRQALIDRFGGSKQRAIGRKASPGPLHGVSADVWSALAVAVTYGDTKRPERSTGKRQRG